jgi:hypothetical protein
MKKGVNPNIILKIQFLPHSKHAVPSLQRATNSSFSSSIGATARCGL